MKPIFMLLVIQVTALCAAAQSFTVSGTVGNAATGEPLAHGSLRLLTAANGSSTDARGRFSIAIPVSAARPRLVFSYTGFVTDTISVHPSAGELQVMLTPLPGALNEVVVTGVSRATLIRENPVAVTNVAARNIDAAIENNIVDALVKNVPGLNAVKTGPNISKPFIRGLGYNRVLTLYDGIRQEGQQWGDEHSIEADAYNIDKAEVIKGPASLMFGSDALAGVVSMFPYLPKEKDSVLHGRILSEYQGNNGLLGNGFRMARNKNHWLWTVRGSYRLAKNYSNRADGRVYNTGFKESNASLMLGYRSANGYTYLNATLYNNLQGIPDGSRDSLSRKFTRQVFEGSMDDITRRPVVPAAILNSYALGPLHQHIQHYRLYTSNHYRLGRGDLDGSVGFQQNIRREYSHPAAPAQAALFVRLNTINYDLKYTLPSIAGIEFTMGANGMQQSNASKDATDFPIPDYRLLDIGGYLYGKWKYNKMAISGGARYDTRQLKGNDFYVATNTSTGFGKQVAVPDTAGATLQFAAFNKKFNGVSLSLGLAWQVSGKLSIKANIARGYRSPNITEFASNGLDPGAHIIYLGNRNFVPEFSFQQDLGMLLQDKNISITVSIFNNHIQNYIYLTQLADAAGNAVLDAQGNKTFQYRQGAAQLYGAEAALGIHPAGWQGFSFSNTLALSYGISKNREYANSKTAGEYLPLMPPLKWVSSVQQEIKTGSEKFTAFNLKAELEYNAAQQRFLALFNTETRTSAYALVNCAAGTQWHCTKRQQLQLLLQVNNLFDIVYQNHLSRLKYFEYYSASPNGRMGMYGMGRNICVKLITSF